MGQLLSLTNRDRAAQGLGPLRWSPELADAARTHGELMVRHNDLEHQFPGEPDVPTRAGRAGAHFRAIAENIAIGPNAADIERQWMHSAMHRTNILDPQMNVIGIALIHNRGEVWAVEDFAHAVEGLGPSEIEGRVIGLLAQQGMEQRDGNRGCAADLRDVAWECGRIAPALHHALGGLRSEPSAGCSGEQAAERAVSFCRGGRLR